MYHISHITYRTQSPHTPPHPPPLPTHQEPQNPPRNHHPIMRPPHPPPRLLINLIAKDPLCMPTLQQLRHDLLRELRMSLHRHDPGWDKHALHLTPPRGAQFLGAGGILEDDVPMHLEDTLSIPNIKTDQPHILSCNPIKPQPPSRKQKEKKKPYQNLPSPKNLLPPLRLRNLTDTNLPLLTPPHLRPQRPSNNLMSKTYPDNLHPPLLQHLPHEPDQP